jgi:hypothetical protein
METGTEVFCSESGNSTRSCAAWGYTCVVKRATSGICASRASNERTSWSVRPSSSPRGRSKLMLMYESWSAHDRHTVPRVTYLSNSTHEPPSMSSDSRTAAQGQRSVPRSMAAYTRTYAGGRAGAGRSRMRRTREPSRRPASAGVKVKVTKSEARLVKPTTMASGT